MKIEEFKLKAFLAVLSSTPAPDTTIASYGGAEELLQKHVNKCMTTALMATSKAVSQGLLKPDNEEL